MRKLGALVLGVVLVATGVYFGLYLYGWEWYRAFVAGVVFVAAEVAAATFYLAYLVRRPPSRASSVAPASVGGEPGGAVRGEPSAVARDVLATTPRTHLDTFSWLQPEPDRLSVFIPLLLGAGFFLSAAAWLVEHVAAALYGERIDTALAEQVAPLIPPDDLLDAPTPERLLTMPGRWADVRFPVPAAGR